MINDLLYDTAHQKKTTLDAYKWLVLACYVRITFRIMTLLNNMCVPAVLHHPFEVVLSCNFVVVVEEPDEAAEIQRMYGMSYSTAYSLRRLSQ